MPGKIVVFEDLPSGVSPGACSSLFIFFLVPNGLFLSCVSNFSCADSDGFFALAILLCFNFLVWNIKGRSWRDGLIAQGTNYSLKGPEFDSKHPGWLTTILNSNLMGSDINI